MSRKILIGLFVDLRGVGDTRWVVPAMAMLYDRKGEKFVTLWRSLGASQSGIRAALEATIGQGWVEKNPGYGHPMRPEYILTKKGAPAGEACSQIIRALSEQGVEWKTLSKWSMTVLHTLRSGPYRFNELATAVEGATDRALAMCLKPLVANGLVQRTVVETYPPSVEYSLTTFGKRLAERVNDLAQALN